MGGAVSLGKKPVPVVHSDVFVCSELLEGSKQLRENVILRKSFVEYVKSGAWLEKITQFVPEQQHLGPKHDPFGSDSKLKHISSHPATPGTQRSLSALYLDGSIKEKQDSAVLEEYVSAAEESFTNAQICCFLFAMVWPIYLKSSAYNLHVKYGSQAARHFEEDSVSIVSAVAETEKVLTPQSSRAQGILLGCAAFFDEAQMQDMLLSDWVDALSLSISAHALAISDVHRTKNEHPIVYANRSFESMFPTKGGSAVGMPVQSVTGKHKEQMKKASFSEAFKSSQCTKLFFPQYSSTKRLLLDGTVVQPAGEYALCAHFTTTPGGADTEQVAMVEDVLAILSCLVPEPVATPSGMFGLPPMAAINSALPFHKLALLSPVRVNSPGSRISASVSVRSNQSGSGASCSVRSAVSRGGASVSVRSNQSGSGASGSVRSAASRGSECRSGMLRSGYKSSSGSSKVGQGERSCADSSVHSFHSVVSTNSSDSPRALKSGAAVVRKFARSATTARLTACSTNSSSSMDVATTVTAESITGAMSLPPESSPQPQE